MEILFSLGSLKVYTMSLFVVIAFFWSGLVISKKALEYHLGETEVLDGITLILILTGIGSKVLSLLDLGKYGILCFFLALLGAGVFCAKRLGEKLMTILDIFSLGVPMSLVWWNLGLFWSGSFTGKVLGGPWGVMGEGIRVWPVEIIKAFLFLLALIWLWKLERTYRVLPWYRGRKSSANTGFVLGSMLVFWGTIEIIGGIMSVGSQLDFWLIRVLAIILGGVIIYHQSGRSLKVDGQAILSRFKKNNSVN